jgi:RHS repeat-associated protein
MSAATFIYDCTPHFAHSCVLIASRYTGKERDTESGNDYFGARYYTSGMGRFMSPDWSDVPAPIPYADEGNPQSLNLYSYVGNNPLSSIDEDGHSTDCGGGGDPSVVCLVTRFWDWLTSGSSDSNTSSNNGDEAPPTPPSGSPHLINRNSANSNSSFHNALPQFMGGPDPCSLVDCNNLKVQQDVMPWGMTGGLSQMVPGVMRMQLLAEVQNPTLRNIISDLYKAGSTFGDGGTADAIAYERATGQAVGGRFHTLKGQQYSAALRKAINSGRLSVREQQIAQWLHSGLQKSLTAVGR